jgi:hypothetical protein
MIRYDVSVFTGNTCTYAWQGAVRVSHTLILRYVSGSTYCKYTAGCPLPSSIGAEEQERIYIHGKNYI